MKIRRLLIIAGVCGAVIWKFNPTYVPDTAYEQAELERVSAFMLYQRRYTEALYAYCLSYNYRLDGLVGEFNHQHARQIAGAEAFVARFQPWERFAFRKEINRVYAEQEPEFLAQLERSYDENLRLFGLGGQSFSRYDFCKWADNHPAELFRGKTDADVMSRQVFPSETMQN